MILIGILNLLDLMAVLNIVVNWTLTSFSRSGESGHTHGVWIFNWSFLFCFYSRKFDDTEDFNQLDLDHDTTSDDSF